MNTFKLILGFIIVFSINTCSKETFVIVQKKSLVNENSADLDNSKLSLFYESCILENDKIVLAVSKYDFISKVGTEKEYEIVNVFLPLINANESFNQYQILSGNVIKPENYMGFRIEQEKYFSGEKNITSYLLNPLWPLWK